MKNRQEEPVTCPLCGSGMHPVFREGRVLFWGCDEFRGSTGCPRQTLSRSRKSRSPPALRLPGVPSGTVPPHGQKRPDLHSLFREGKT